MTRPAITSPIEPANPFQLLQVDCELILDRMLHDLLGDQVDALDRSVSFSFAVLAQQSVADLPVQVS
jgi:hypothetical protein